LKFKIGDKVKIVNKSTGRPFKHIKYNSGVILNSWRMTKRTIYNIYQDYFLECDLRREIDEILFTDEDFNIL